MNDGWAILSAPRADRINHSVSYAMATASIRIGRAISAPISSTSTFISTRTTPCLEDHRRRSNGANAFVVLGVRSIIPSVAFLGRILAELKIKTLKMNILNLRSRYV